MFLQGKSNTVSLVLLLIVAVSARYLAALGELGLDEVWTINLLGSVHSVADIFLKIHHDNNHYLNSIWVWLCGLESPALTLRFLSLLCGAACVLLAWSLQDKIGIITARIFCFFLACSYVFILYGSEARGYSSMLLFILCAFAAYLHQRWPIYWLASLLAYLSHPVSLQFLFCLVLADLFAEFRLAGFSAARRALIHRHALPIFLIALFVIFVQGAPELGGGPQLSHVEIGFNALLAVIGLPELSLFNVPASAWAFLAALLLLGILTHEAWQLRNEFAGRGIFFLFLVVIFPMIVVLVVKPPVLFVRYFLPAILFAYLLLARFLARMWGRGAAGCGAVLFCLGVFTLLQLDASRTLWRWGRSSFAEILEFIQDRQPTGVLSVAGYPDYRNELLINFSARHIQAAEFVYQAEQYPDNLSSNWVILQSQDEYFVPDAQLKNEYYLEKSWPAARYSGIRVHLYRKLH